MTLTTITSEQKDAFNTVITHPLQAYEWGAFREKTGVRVIRKGIENNGRIIDGFQMTLHPIPHTPYFIGYIPKGTLPNKELLTLLKDLGKEYNCIFIQLEPDVVKDSIKEWNPVALGLYPAAHPLFTKYTFLLDLTKSEEELLKHMHAKTRYNIRVAQKHGVVITQDNSEEAFAQYLHLTEETTRRQKFYAHTKHYHTLMWETLKNQKPEMSDQNFNDLHAHLFTARYKPTEGKEIILTSYVLFVFHDTLYYPYGASSDQHRNVMASNLLMWEVIKFGKRLGLTKFDMWGAVGPDTPKDNPWQGFHRFKEGYGPTLTEFVGSFDLVINPLFYEGYKLANKARWPFLRLKKLFS